MADAPKQQQLVLEQFPKQPWAKALVSAFNQFVQQTVAALTRAAPTYKELSFKTATTVADSFPIDVTTAFPVKDARIACVVSGAPSGATAVRWQLLSQGAQQSQSGANSIRVSFIDGLAANTAYTIRLALE